VNRAANHAAQQAAIRDALQKINASQRHNDALRASTQAALKAEIQKGPDDAGPAGGEARVNRAANHAAQQAAIRDALQSSKAPAKKG